MKPVYRVDVSQSTRTEKRKVQDAFFELGYFWVNQMDRHAYLSAKRYTNAYEKDTTPCDNLLFGSGSDLDPATHTAKEFLNLFEEETTTCTHADKILQYAEDAQTNAEPWKLWESSTDGVQWCTHKHSHPDWVPEMQYRRKPKTININGFEVPEPVRKPLQECEIYWVADNVRPELSDYYMWRGDKFDQEALSRGIIHRTKEAAQQHAKALLSFTTIE